MGSFKNNLFVAIAHLIVIAIQVSGQDSCAQLKEPDQTLCVINSEARKSQQDGAPAKSVRDLKYALVYTLSKFVDGHVFLQKSIAEARNEGPRTGAKYVEEGLIFFSNEALAAALVAFRTPGYVLAFTQEASQPYLEKCLFHIEKLGSVFVQGNTTSFELLANEGRAASSRSFDAISGIADIISDGAFKEIKIAAKYCFNSLTSFNDDSDGPDPEPKTSEAKFGIELMLKAGEEAKMDGADEDSVDFLVKNGISAYKTLDAAGVKANLTLDAFRSENKNMQIYINVFRKLDISLMTSLAKLYIGIAKVGKVENINIDKPLMDVIGVEKIAFGNLNAALGFSIEVIENGEPKSLTEITQKNIIAIGIRVGEGLVKSVLQVLDLIPRVY